MLHELISHSPDLKRLQKEGYEIEVINSHLLLHHVPYVNSRCEVAYGVLVCPLGELAGNRTSSPQNHVVYFAGEHPCDWEGNLITGLVNQSGKIILGENLEADYSFSSKLPSGNYPDYYEQVTSYIKIIESHAQAIDSSVTAKTYKPIKIVNPDSVFRYLDSNSARSEIEMISSKLQNLKIAIVGLGGTGSYVLDFVSKTHVKEIHLFDDDRFLTHNAFRAPGAASIEVLEESLTKVAYLRSIYSKMHISIFAHEYRLSDATLEELAGMSFIFVCIDEGEVKKQIINKLIELSIPFVDVGIGLTEVDGSLIGIVRVTTGTPEKHDHFERQISFGANAVDEYATNIQIAEINALNAALAVIKWKKIFGFYHDLEKEHQMAYDIAVNKIMTDETLS